VLDPRLGVRPQVLVLGPVVGVIGRPVARGVRALDADDEEEMVPITEATIQSWIDEVDDDMQAWTVFCAGPASMASATTPPTRLRAGNTHCAWSVSDLTPIVAALEIDSKPFFGPVQRADGVFQLYVELPYHHYLEIDSLTFNGTVGTPSARTWADVV
jgi:hypothetical protein